MTKIEIDTDLADEIAGRLVHDGEDVRRIVADLDRAIDDLVTDEEVRASVQEIVGDALAHGRRVAEA